MIVNNTKALSLEELAGRVRHGFYDYCKQILPVTVALNGEVLPVSNPYWLLDVYADSLVCAKDGGEYYGVTYTLSAEGIQFAPVVEWEAVEKEWVAANYPDAETKRLEPPLGNVIFFGSEVKALGEGKVGGFLVQYSEHKDPDLVRDFFDAKSDLDIENGERLSVYYDHGLDATLKNRKIGRGAVEYKDAGLWLEAQLDRRDAYEAYVYKMAEEGKLGWSSGPAQHLVRREPVGKSMHITHWPIKEASLTPMPAEFRNGVVMLKSLPQINLEEAVKSLTPNTPEAPQSEPEAKLPETARAVVTAVTTDEQGDVVVKSTSNIQITERETMADVQTPPVQDEWEAKFNAQGARLEQALKALENLPISKNPGYVTADGGTADKNIKSFGDYLVAIRRGDVKRLEEVYEVKALSEDTGASGGYTVPEAFEPRLLQVAASNSQIVAQLEPVPVTSPRGKIPALDMFFTTTAGVGQTALAGGINPSAIMEGGAYSASDPNFELIEWDINKVGFKTTLSNELMSDSPISMEALLTRLAGIAIGAKTEYYVLRGTGAGTPLGILNAPCLITQAAASTNTFAYIDAATMQSRHMATSDKVFWLMHKSTIPDIVRFEVGTGGAVWIANVSAGMGGMPLLGSNIIFSEHLPKADNAGHVIYADLGAYLLFVKGAMTVAYSEHADFGNGNVVWRFDRRLDGQPWMKAAVTDANPQGSFTNSPFVSFNN